MLIQVFLSLSFDEDLAKAERMDKDQKFKNKKGKKRKNTEASNQLPENDRKKSRQESISKTREEVNIFPIKITVLEVWLIVEMRFY
jgi:nucleolar complex protein 3